LLLALGRVVPADWISLNDIAPDPADTVVLIEPPFPAEAHEVFARHAHENPLLVRYQGTFDGRAYRFSDVISAGELHALDLYKEFYAQIGLEHQIAFTLHHDHGRVLAVALSRTREDFTHAERDLLNQARPFLIQAYRNAIEHTSVRDELERIRRTQGRPDVEALRARGLTGREAEVLGLIAAGGSSAGVAKELAVSERTVQKHLERAYRKLRVRSRSQASAAAWTSAEGQGATGPSPRG
jgi:DNA-binding NarL/FixJ family response regulator